MIRWNAMAVLICFIPMTGCGSAGPTVVPVKGQIVHADGAPFHPTLAKDEVLPPGDPGLRVKFVRLDSEERMGSESYLAVVDLESATFELPGPMGKGIPPGRYLAIVYAGPSGAAIRVDDQKRRAPPTSEDAVDETAMDGKEIARQEVAIAVGMPQELRLEVRSRR